MRIAICGPRRKEVISKVEAALGTEARKPESVDATIIDYAAETYKDFESTNALFDGSAFDFLVNDYPEGYDDVYEQVALNTLENLTYIAVIAMDMDKDALKVYEFYQSIFPEKIYIYSTPVDFELRLR